ncbi:vesicle-associated membrane protein [Striga asiatica]|uniref:Vesicle-associated membrane protein n=1 Tax=Striga asiatica TaxID=4170 RepID=A0A5A7QJ34_STRAF|nr:vesicle-associated membrane protein [Striga asiatica]
MSNDNLLQIEPLELQFPFELKRQISCNMQLTNKSDNYVAFKVKTTNPKKYCVRPNTGVVVPHSTCDVMVTMQAQKEAPPDMQCRDKFLLQSVVVSPGLAAKDITAEMFNKESGNKVDECKLKVVYAAPLQPPSPVREGSEEGSSPRASISENETVNQTSDLNDIRIPDPKRMKTSKGFSEAQENTSEFKLISRLTEEKNSVIVQNHKLQQELELLRRQRSRSHGGIPFMYVVILLFCPHFCRAALGLTCAVALSAEIPPKSNRGSNFKVEVSAKGIPLKHRQPAITAFASKQLERIDDGGVADEVICYEISLFDEQLLATLSF